MEPQAIFAILNVQMANMILNLKEKMDLKNSATQIQETKYSIRLILHERLIAGNKYLILHVKEGKRIFPILMML